MAGYGSSDDDYVLWAGCGKIRRFSNFAKQCPIRKLIMHYYLVVSDPNKCKIAGYGSSDDDYDPVLRAGCDTLLGPMVFDTVDAR